VEGLDVCDKCKGTGFVLAKHKINGSEYAFKCSCPLADTKGITDRIERWNGRKSIQFTTEFQTVSMPDPRQVTADQGKKDEDDLPF
jgi:hypothetical protein